MDSILIEGSYGIRLHANGTLTSDTNGPVPAIYQTKDSNCLIANIKIFGTYKKLTIARLIAQCFIPPTDDVKNKIVGYKDNNFLNIDHRNLYWTSTAEQQNIKFIAKRNAAKQQYGIPNLPNPTVAYYPNAIESKDKSGYYHIPNTDGAFVINKQGDIYDLCTNSYLKISSNKKGYKCVTLLIDNKFVQQRVHRILALLFCPKPERHTNKDFNELVVNHIDGDTINNDILNLEWVTNSENLEHARKLELFSKSRPVLVKVINTAVVNRYKSISECSRVYGIDCASLHLHLNSTKAGSIIKDGLLFKYDDGTEWPEKAFEVESGWKLNFLLRNIITNEELKFPRRLEVAKFLNIPLVRFNNLRQYHGKKFIFNDWIVSYIPDTQL